MMAPTIYHRIDGTKYRNVWVVGDLHGCYTRLMSELHRVDFDPAQDLLISVGDLIDRGTENVECLELLQMPWFRAVVGNHELLMLDALSPDGNVNNWLMNGGQWFFMLDADQEILARALVELVRRLPYIIELNTGQETIVIAHAAIRIMNINSVRRCRFSTLSGRASVSVIRWMILVAKFRAQIVLSLVTLR